MTNVVEVPNMRISVGGWVVAQSQGELDYMLRLFLVSPDGEDMAVLSAAMTDDGRPYIRIEQAVQKGGR